MNFYSELYERIPEDHLLKRINQAVDFSFINEMAADSYCALWETSKGNRDDGEALHTGAAV